MIERIMSRPSISKKQNSTNLAASKTSKKAKNRKLEATSSDGLRISSQISFNRSKQCKSPSNIADLGNPSEISHTAESSTQFNAGLQVDSRFSDYNDLLRTQRVYCKFLGLEPNETDESVILHASSRMAQLVNERKPFNAPEVIVRSRSEIALATYRLLDPRRRANPWQRIQLIRPLNREDRQTPSSPSNSLWSQTEPASSLGDAESDQIPQIGSSPSSPSSQEPSGWINRQVIDRALEQTASQATLVDSNHDARSWLEERREIVRTLKSSEDNMSRDKRQEKSTLSWLLSVFGR